MPLTNRVLPSGEIIADPARGLMMGNRGGRIHDPETQMLHPTKRWANKQWICCQTEFNGRHRQVMGNSYTELFFLDEVTAMAAGHRPCGECRHAAFADFAERWRKIAKLKKRLSVKQMDVVLHSERLHDRQKAIHRTFWEDLPSGAMVAHEGGAVAKLKDAALRWTPNGYEPVTNSEAEFSERLVSCLTPPTLVSILRAGYKPIWHASADT